MPYRLARTFKFPFDLYDFFGYLFPGSFFAFGLIVLYYANTSQGLTVSTVVTDMTVIFAGLNVVTGLLVVFFFVITFYLLGHLVASFGSLALEKVLLKGIFGYPYTYYLDLRKRTRRIFSEALYKIVFIVINLTLLFGILSIIHNDYATYFWWFLWVAIAVASVRAFLVSFKYKLVDPGTHRFNSQRLEKWLRPIANVIEKSFHYGTTWTIDLFCNGLFKSTGVLNQFEPEVITRFRVKFRTDFGLDIEDAGTNVFWLCYTYVLRNCPNSEAIIKNFLHMFSFARHITSACLLLIAIQLIITFGTAVSGDLLATYVICMVLYVIAVIMMFRYFYIYSSYYTKFLFRVYLVSSETKGDGCSAAADTQT